MLLFYHLLRYNTGMSKKHLTVRIEETEKDILAQFCVKVGRTQSDVVREFVRSLKPKRLPKEIGLGSID